MLGITLFLKASSKSTITFDLEDAFLKRINSQKNLVDTGSFGYFYCCRCLK